MRHFPILLAALAVAAPAMAFGGRKSSDAPMDGSALIEEMKQGSVDKKRVETFVKRRLAKINDHHKARMDFMAKEADTWAAFWGKVRDERRLFEIRLSRQMLDFFESMSSISGSDRDAAIADFEKMQGNVISAFETQQRQKLEDFFAARDRRWKEFVQKQEDERTQFMAEAPSDWRATRPNAALPSAKGGGDGSDDAAADPGDGGKGGR